MTALPIQITIDQLRSAGLALALTTDNTLKVTPASSITSALRELIRSNKAALIDWLQLPQANANADAEAANDTTEPLIEPLGYQGTGWRLAGADGLSPETLAKFRAASLALDLPANHLQIQGVHP